MSDLTPSVRILWAAGLWITIGMASYAQGALVPEGTPVWSLTDKGGTVSPEAGMLTDTALGDPETVPVAPRHDYGKKYARMMDGVPADDRPYVVPGLKPFRFKHFTNEFSYGGWHNWNLSDYAASHGFEYIYNYGGRPPVSQLKHLPKGTEYLTWGGFGWHKWMATKGIDPKRYDKLMDLEPTAKDFGQTIFTRPAGKNKLLMIDVEHGALVPAKLRQQPWYPEGSVRTKIAFERKYYAGYARTYTLPIQLARAAGWAKIGLYGWDPGGRQAFGWETPEKLRESNLERWDLYGRLIYSKVDLVYNSVYCFYWTPDNPAYVLANVDENIRMVAKARPAKPVRPYYWWLLHGGGGGWRWWQYQPMPDEQVEAITVLGFFTGQKGMVLWSWSGTGSDQAPPEVDVKPTKRILAPKRDVQIGTAFEAPGASRTFKRYDHVHILAVTDGAARFQLVGNHLGKDKGVGDTHPVYTMDAAKLRQHLRPRAEPVGAMFRGLALVHRFEEFLATGQVKIDVPAAKQLTGRLPIVRRVKNGNLHLVATCDPHAPIGQAGRPIVLKNFDGNPGLIVTLPTRHRVQLFVLKTDRQLPMGARSKPPYGPQTQAQPKFCWCRQFGGARGDPVMEFRGVPEFRGRDTE